ncbi:hypothetical protein [Halorarius litoreus]|uniref:hypothetical protein n=1 Tax=Halorarius litoreus TaxID=2962676 RepID=UPI0020CB916C|nr:hypothetical protein [Halorarius litoreus]
MSEDGTSEIVGVDVAAAVETGDSTAATLHSLVEFDRSGFNTLYVSETTRAAYESEDEMEAYFERIHNYVNIDFTEIELFTADLFPVANRVRYKTTALDVITLVRMYLDNRRGLFFAVERGDPVEPLVADFEALFVGDDGD